MLGIGHRDDSAAVADTAGPARDMSHVENSIAALQRDGVPGFCHAVIGAQDQVGHAHVEPAVQPDLAMSHRRQPAEGNGEAA